MRDLTLRRVIDAPVERIYAAWTDPGLLKQWLAPGSAVASRGRPRRCRRGRSKHSMGELPSDRQGAALGVSPASGSFHS
ncbi:MAG: hypothetical protein F4060_02390 [Holophagales bacterium]|nr:hypothetical protein [Holophagales bacterium]MYG30079.1 hypothetical protein [Holophagales bacterium]MYI78767.1 hypothetical protein [Holophagales bacterium]